MDVIILGHCASKLHCNGYVLPNWSRRNNVHSHIPLLPEIPFCVLCYYGSERKMDLCKFREAGTSVRIIPGPNGISFASEDRNNVKFVEENIINNIHEIGINSIAPERDVSFSSYLSPEEENLRLSKKKVLMDTEAEGYSHQSRPKAGENNFLVPLKAAVDEFAFGSYPYAEGHVEIHNIKTRPEKQSPIQSVAVTGNVIKDSEISIFEAKKYFNAEEVKKTDENEPTTKVSNQAEDSEIQKQAKNKVLFTPSPGKLYDSSCHRISSPLPSMDSLRRGISPRGSTPTASSEASWNSHSGLLPQSISKFQASDRKKSTSGKWSIPRFGCTCPCSNKKSVEIEDSLEDKRRAPVASNSMSSSVTLVDSHLSSIQYSYPGLGKRVLSRSIEMQKSGAVFEDSASEISDVHSSSIKGGVGGVKSLLNPLTPIVNQNSGISKDKELIQKLQRNSTSFRRYDANSHEGEFIDRERLHHRRIVAKEDGFSFPVLHPLSRKLEEKPRPSLEVFGSHYPNSPDRHEDKHPSDVNRRLVLFSLDKTLKSFSTSEASKFISDNNIALEDGDEDNDSNSSSDLFEIESFTTQGTCYPLKLRDSLDDTSSIQSGYPASCEMSFQNSFHFRGIEEPVTPSAQSSYYEPSEASVDWSVTTGDIMDKASLGNFSSDFEEKRMIKTKQLKRAEFSGLREATYKGDCNSKKSSGGFLGCRSQKALSVVPPTPVSRINKYEERRIAMSNFRSDSLGLPRGTIQSEKRVTNINTSALSGQRSTTKSSHLVAGT